MNVLMGDTTAINMLHAIIPMVHLTVLVLLDIQEMENVVKVIRLHLRLNKWVYFFEKNLPGGCDEPRSIYNIGALFVSKI